MEKAVLGGFGSVDVSLLNAQEKIACEISITTSPEHELNNIQKCLAHGYDIIAVLSNEKKHLDKIRKLAETQLDKSTFKKLFFLQPEEFIEFLDQRKQPEKIQRKTVRGYTVNVQYMELNISEEKQKREAAAGLIIDSIERIKKQKK